MSDTLYVSTVGYLFGDSILNIRRLIDCCRVAEVKLICGTYALDVFKFAQKYIEGCNFSIVEMIDDPDDHANKYCPGLGAPAYMRAWSELHPKYPEIRRLDEASMGMPVVTQYPLSLKEPQSDDGHIVLHPYTRHTWKLCGGTLYRLKFKTPEVYLAGQPKEPELKAAIDMREWPFEKQALKTATAKAVVGLASSFTCLASIFCKRQIIVSYTKDVSFWPWNQNAIKVVDPPLKELQELIDREGL